ncbi:C-X-C motif chemokine 11-6-like [Limanda limanda]|uniref:C-X-C motif chemokine 11-6-like n=1 Tax=Limanda limanda TaxID=27771 RepID=UPI0029C62922|nr:C-X-C motif chemokine 11-6-like [Limanda limanda]XP_060935734.1 C-X-C motif chemokine 11-6-like [Limanda limanda]
MSSIMKVLLLLAAAVCISTAMIREPGQNCLCQGTRNGIGGSKLKEIQIYQPNSFCNRQEIVVTTDTGRLCLNPDSKAVKALLRQILRKKRAAIKPTQSS